MFNYNLLILRADQEKILKYHEDEIEVYVFFKSLPKKLR